MEKNRLINNLRLNNIDYKFGEIIELFINNNEGFIFNVNIYHEDLKVLFMISDNYLLNNILESINMILDDYERIEDIIFDLNHKIKNINSYNNKDYFIKKIEKIKYNFIENNSNFKFELFSVQTYSEMLKDQIIKIYDNNKK